MNKTLAFGAVAILGLLALAGCGTAASAAHHRGLPRGLVAGVLAKDSGKTTAQVQVLKTKGVKWSQVAADLGLQWSTVRGQLKAAAKN